MSKQAKPRALPENEAKCVARMLRVSPQKLNLLAQLIRGKKVETALADLEFSRKRIALDVKKTLESAIANAENNHDLDVDDLIVAEAHVGKALVMKRMPIFFNASQVLIKSSVKKATCWMPSPLNCIRNSSIWPAPLDDSSFNGIRIMPSGAVMALEVKPVYSPLMSK